MLISVHLPKTAGISFRFALESQFVNGLQLDYSDHPIHNPPFVRNKQALMNSLQPAGNDYKGIQCIHGYLCLLSTY